MQDEKQRPKADQKKLEDLKKAKQKATDPAIKKSIEKKMDGLKEAFNK